MYVRVRDLSKKPGEQDTLITISKNALIEDFREEIFDKTGIEVDRQRLFYMGKLLIDGQHIIDYGIKLNDVIQLMAKVELLDSKPVVETVDEAPAAASTSDESVPREEGQSKYYQVKDLVDYLEPENGAWFEGVIERIFKNVPEEPVIESNKEPDLIFQVKDAVNDGLIEVNFNEILPRAYYYYKPEELTIGLTVFANYNMEKPNTRGYWYEYIITRKTATFLQGTIVMGKARAKILDRTVKFMDEFLRIEKPVLITERSQMPKDIPRRKTAYNCEKCQDLPNKKCLECGCKVCGGKHDAAKIILCDECNSGYHIMCLDPPLSKIPSDPEWYCPDCKTDTDEIVKAGDKLKYSHKKANSARVKNKKNIVRDWGRGMGTVGPSTTCTTVSKHHLGPIPGVPVGTNWKFRVQVSESGVHRPQVAGIHGCENKHAFSLVLAGGYDDDVDNGEEFIYSGSGGRDLSGNKRVSEQCKDQVLTRTNKALALSCNTPFNVNGGEADDWKAGKPVRVVRNCKLKRRSEYAPADGNRYDGIYKVVKYYKEKGKSGFHVWKYLLRRDDPEPAPWHQGGQDLEVMYPEKYLEAFSQKENVRAVANTEKRSKGTAKGDDKQNRKRNSKGGVKREASKDLEPPPKKIKIQPFLLDNNTSELIEKDVVNKKKWDECKKILEEGQPKFLQIVKDTFMCVCCQEILNQPVTLECQHNVCKACLKRSFASEIYNCPYCRLLLEKDYVMTVNETLQSALVKLFPGYNVKS